MAKAELRLWVPEWVHRHMGVRARMMSMGPLHIDVEREDLACHYLAAGFYAQEKGADGACNNTDPWGGIACWPPVFELPTASVVALEDADRLPEQFATLRKSIAAKIRILKSHSQHLDSTDADDAYDADGGDAYDDSVLSKEPERWRISMRNRALDQLEQAEAALRAIEQTEALLYEAEVLPKQTKDPE